MDITNESFAFEIGNVAGYKKLFVLRTFCLLLVDRVRQFRVQLPYLDNSKQTKEIREMHLRTA